MNAYYSHIRKDIISLIPGKKYNALLDVGCGEGFTAELIKKDLKIPFVAGVEINEDAIKSAVNKLDKLYPEDIDSLINRNEIAEKYDIILFADVIEHLVNPWNTLKNIKSILNQNAIIIASLPNLAYIPTLKKIFFNKWLYTESGILDRTHLRFFTEVTIRDLFYGAGYEIIIIEEEKCPGFKRNILNLLTFKYFKHLMASKYLIVAELRNVDNK